MATLDLKKYGITGTTEVVHNPSYEALFEAEMDPSLEGFEKGQLTELEDLANIYDKFVAAGCEIYSVSTDTHFVHKAWHDASDRIKKIRYPMLADPTHAISKDFEVLIEADGMAERGTFIINPQGKIVSYEVSAGNVGRNADELLRKLQACQFVYEHGDEVCPAKWQPGGETLKPSLDLVGML